MPPSQVDFSALTHVIHFALVPNSNGSVDASANSVTPAYASNLIAVAHSAGCKVLICVGGADSETGFQGATSAANRGTFINNLVSFMSLYGYDGVDVDWEPLPSSDFNQYTNFVKALRSALDGLSPRKLLTAAAAAYPVYGDSATAQYTMFASLQGQFDQINIMTYDLSGPWPGWVTWFNSPIYDGGLHFPNTSTLVPSVDGAVNNFLSGGVAPARLGIGIAFYGYLWTHGAGTSTGGTLLPRQSWTTAPSASTVPYYNILGSYFQSNLYHWDTTAQAAYLSITNTIATNDVFLSYDDEHTCQAKVSYARNRFLGGVMIWELRQGYRSAQPAGQRDALLQSLKQALATPRLMGIQRTNEDIRISFSSLPLAAYRVLVSTNLPSGPWATLTNNVPGTGAPILLEDPSAATRPQPGFYRVKTPP